MFSDHCPIELKIEEQKSKKVGRKNRSFKFEEYWTKYSNCANTISNNGNWNGNDVASSSLSSNLNNYSKILFKWGKEINANRKNRIRDCKKALKEAYGNAPNVNFDNIHNIEFEIDKLLEE